MNTRQPPKIDGGSVTPHCSTLLRSIFPTGVSAAELRSIGPLAEAEPGSRRARDFAAGRLCVRSASTVLGIGDFSLGTLPDRAPHWPEAITGSITHTDGFCGAVLAHRHRFRALGLDAEVVGRVTPEIWPLICVPEELALLMALPRARREAAAALIFSAKECFYKCQYTLTHEWLEFEAVAIQFWESGTCEGWFAVHPRQKLLLEKHVATPWIGRFRFERELIVAGMSIAV